MYNNYTLKVPRAEFEKIVEDHNHPFFNPEGPYIVAGGCEIWFTYRRGPRRVRVIASLVDNDYEHSKKPYLERQIIATFNRMVKYPKYELADLPMSFDVKQITYSNPKCENIKLDYAICYDMNSAFGFAELGLIPDTDREYSGPIRPGDVGIRMKKDEWIFAKKGYGLKNFPLIPWNADKFVNLYYERKNKSKTPEEKQKNKDYLNHHVGYLKYHNQIIRSWIIWNSNQNILQYKDENTVLMVTDSIISTVPRPDIPIGDKIGEFKITDEGAFAKRNMDYQFYETGTIKKRGLNKADRQDYDILEEKKVKANRVNISSGGYNFIKGKFVK